MTSRWTYAQPSDDVDIDDVDNVWNMEWGNMEWRPLAYQQQQTHRMPVMQGLPLIAMPTPVAEWSVDVLGSELAVNFGQQPEKETPSSIARGYALALPIPTAAQKRQGEIQKHVDTERKVTDSTDSTEAPSQSDTVDDADEILPSIGSRGHIDGTCKRCTFFPKGKCRNAFDCTFCHYEHDARKRHRKRRGGGASGGGGNALDEDAEENEEFIDQDLEELAAVTCKVCEPMSEGIEELMVEPGEVTRISLEDLLPSPIAVGTPLAAGRVTLSLNREREGKDATEFDTNAPSSDAPSSPALSSDSEEGAADNDECTISDASPRVAEVDISPDRELISVGVVRGDKGQEVQEDREENVSCASLTPVDVARRSRAILNKLTTDRFERLYLQLMALPLQTPEHLSALVAQIFQTATVQSAFLPLYAELCSRIDSRLASDETLIIGGKAFRRALVNECQASFERNLQDQGVAATKDLTAEERYEEEVKFKTQMLGNMRFIGELLVRRLLASKMLLPILGELLGQGSEAAIESLVALVTVVAPHFEQGPLLCAAPLKEAFAALKRKSLDKTVSSRVRFQLRDLLELRARGWEKRS